MILRSTTFAGKGFALGISVAAHVAIAVAARGPHRGASPAPARAVPVEFQIEPMAAEPEPLQDAPLPNRVSPAAAHHTHTHPYPVPPDHDLVPHDPSLVHAVAPALPAAPAPPTPLPLAASDAPPAFTMTLPANVASGSASASIGGMGAGMGGDGDDDAPLAEAAVDTPARRVDRITPAYPPEARESESEANVPLLLVLSRTGAVESVEVVRRAGHGFDEAAVLAARKFQFSPAIKNGRPVRVRVSWTVQFRLE